LPDFQLGRARDLDLRSGDTAYHRTSLTDLYLQAKCFTEIKETLCGRTDVRKYVRTDGHLRLALLGRLC